MGLASLAADLPVCVERLQRLFLSTEGKGLCLPAKVTRSPKPGKSSAGTSQLCPLQVTKLGICAVGFWDSPLISSVYQQAAGDICVFLAFLKLSAGSPPEILVVMKDKTVRATTWGRGRLINTLERYVLWFSFFLIFLDIAFRNYLTDQLDFLFFLIFRWVKISTA